jgi:hypothetical protein
MVLSLTGPEHYVLKEYVETRFALVTGVETKIEQSVIDVD